jgi:hypothetical protein
MFMLPIRSMVAFEVVPVKHAAVEVRALPGIGEHATMLGADVLGGGHEEARRAACGIADLIRRLRRLHIDHQLNDVSRRPELAVHAGRTDLGEQVLVGSPLVSRSSSGSWSSMSTTLDSRAASGMVKRAPRMCSE